MKCPHCHSAFHENTYTKQIGNIGHTKHWHFYWTFHGMQCPACDNPIILVEYQEDHGQHKFKGKTMMVFPKVGVRSIRPPEVPEHVGVDYDEACLVLIDSPQASAALSRRCLQHLLKDCGISNSDNLSTAINAALETNPPSHIAENLDSIRNTGNFAAHPQKSINTGEILPVEPHEAEWNLEVLEMLFDFYYVQPAKSASRRAALNAKLAEAGKPPMKSPDKPKA